MFNGIPCSSKFSSSASVCVSMVMLLIVSMLSDMKLTSVTAHRSSSELSLDSGVQLGEERLHHGRASHEHGGVVTAGELPKFASVGKLYVSGVSSGAYMAGQLGVAYSSMVAGVGMFAGGPYGCARGNLEQALGACTDDSIPLDLPTLESLTRDASNLGTIDNLSNIAGMPVWILHGIADATVKSSVVEANAEMYESWGADVIYNYTIPANHAWLSPLGQNPCEESATPYTSNCAGTDPVGDMLAHIMRKTPIPPNTGGLKGKLTTFSQDSYSIAKWGLSASMLSMDTTGYLYTPPQCVSDVVCDVMLVLHGCEQSHSIVGMALIEQSYIPQYADTNNLIVIFPQTIALELGVVINPKACWDWWGYLGDDSLYLAHGGYQIEVLMAMVKAMTRK